MGMIGYATRNIPKFLDPLPGGTGLVDGIEFLVSWARANSLWPLIYGTACCAMEMMATGSSRHDWARFGVEVARATPRQADLIVLAGTIVEKMGPRLVTLYEQMPGPKYVIAMGSCAISGGPFYYDSYSVVKGGDRLIPVDVYIPGCPPRPEALLHGIMELQKKIRTEGRRNPWHVRGVNTGPVFDPFLEAQKTWAQEEAARLPLSTGKAAGERTVQEQFPEITRTPGRPPLLAHTTVIAHVRESFPDAVPTGEEAAEPVPGLPPRDPNDPVELAVSPARYPELLAFLKNSGLLKLDFLLQVTAVDRKDRFEVLTQLLSTANGNKLFVRCAIDREEAEIDSIVHLYGGANWHEREVFDLFGIRFRNHPDPRRLFLEDDFPGHPLRKDFHDPSRVVPRPY